MEIPVAGPGIGNMGIGNGNQGIGNENQGIGNESQGIGNEIIAPGDEVGRGIGDVQCNERLGGMLKYYYRDAA